MNDAPLPDAAAAPPPYDAAAAEKAYTTVCSQCHELGEVDKKPPTTAKEVKEDTDFGVEGQREAGEFTGYFARRFAQIEQDQQTLSDKLDTLGSQLATLIEKLGAE